MCEQGVNPIQLEMSARTFQMGCLEIDGSRDGSVNQPSVSPRKWITGLLRDHSFSVLLKDPRIHSPTRATPAVCSSSQ